jgi:2,3-bisphosphoglycerate-independent phosphoglycerate mutase
LCRGPIEAVGIGLDMQVGDVLLRANLATVRQTSSGYQILDRRAGRIQENISELCESLENTDLGNDISGSLYPATQHRCVLRLRGPQLSPYISDTDPGGKGLSRGILNSQAHSSGDAAATHTSEALNQFTSLSHQILDCHPVNAARVQNNEMSANGVLARGAGAHQVFRNLLTYLDLKAAVVSGDSTILGLGNLFSFTTYSDPSFTALTDTDIDNKLATAIEALESHDIAYVHIKGTDITAHDRNPRAKTDFISNIDLALGKFDLSDLVLGICADHSTDSRRGEHNGDPVPVLIQNPVGRKDTVVKFGETDCSTGALGRLNAQEFLTSVLDAMGCLGNYMPSEAEFFRPTL